MSRTAFVSDLHIDQRTPEIGNTFIEYLADPGGDLDALFILGDLFEAWVGDDYSDEHTAKIEAALKQRTALHPVYIMHGNRDFLLGDTFCQRTGTSLISENTVIDLYGTPALLLHGDSLCTDDRDYQEFRKMVRNPDWQQQFLQLPLEQRLQIAREARDASKNNMQSKSEEIMDVNEDAVRKTLQEYKVSRMIHGHTHRPAIHEFPLDEKTTGQRIVLGDWYTQGSALMVSKTDLELTSFDLKKDT